MSMLSFTPAYGLPIQPEQQRWLVTDLWSEHAVGIVGGQPKSFKTFLALDLAVSVASGTPCLRRFPVARPGRVLLYAAEDALDTVRQRLEGICAAAGIKLAELDVLVITEPSMRLDIEAVRRRLEETIAKLSPRLLLLDPFVRLHRIDENASGEVAPLLAYLRELQRRYAVAVLLVHHAKKGAERARGGQALRGSSEFHAWGDSNLYLHRQRDDTLTLTVEHRAAPSPPILTLELAKQVHAVALQIVERSAPAKLPPASVDERIITALTDIDQPLLFDELRAVCRTRSATVYEHLDRLVAAGRLLKSHNGYRLSD
jgi:AAA domain